MVEHKLVLFATVLAFWTLVTLLIKPFCLKSFVPVTGLECSYGKIFIPVNEISVAKTEISVTGPARPLLWTHRCFYKEKTGEARYRKPSQPGWPGSYEEALRRLQRYSFLSKMGRWRWTPGWIRSTTVMSICLLVVWSANFRQVANGVNSVT